MITADYNFRLIDVAQSPAQALTFDTTVNGTNIRFVQHRFIVSPAQTVSGCSLICCRELSWGRVVYLYGPQNQQLNGYGTYLSADFEQTLPADGIMFDHRKFMTPIRAPQNSIFAW